MVLNFKRPVLGPEKGGSTDRVRRRMILALSISVILHIVVAISMRPDYKPVADHAVEFTVSKVIPGPPKKKPALPAPEPEKPVEPKPEAPPPKKKPGPGTGVKPAKEIPEETGPMDGGPADDGGPGEEQEVAKVGEAFGSGICMPNLFPFTRVDSSWVLWVSLSSFRETVIQNAVTSTLARFAMGKELVGVTGLDPNKDVEGVIVGAKDIFKPSTYQIVVGYDSSEGKVRATLTDHLSDKAPVQWTETQGGWDGEAGSSAWHLVGSGRVLVAGQKPSIEDGLPGSRPRWPNQVECVSGRNMETSPGPLGSASQTNEKRLIDLAKAFISPDATGRWPVALLATSDPRTLGLGRGRGKNPKFEHARIRAFFSDPILIEGEVRFSGSKTQIDALAADWRKTAATVSKDPFFAMAGLSSLFNNLTINTTENKIVFSLRLTEGQVRAALLFLQLQGEVLERHLKGQ